MISIDSVMGAFGGGYGVGVRVRVGFRGLFEVGRRRFKL